MQFVADGVQARGEPSLLHACLLVQFRAGLSKEVLGLVASLDCDVLGLILGHTGNVLAGVGGAVAHGGSLVLGNVDGARLRATVLGSAGLVERGRAGTGVVEGAGAVGGGCGCEGIFGHGAPMHGWTSDRGHVDGVRERRRLRRAPE